MIGALIIVVIRAVLTGFISVLGWTLYNWCSTSDIAALAYTTIPATWVIFLTSVVPFLLIAGMIAWTIAPLFTQRDSAEADNRSMLGRLFGV